jgi:hypothetical protein
MTSPEAHESGGAVPPLLLLLLAFSAVANAASAIAGINMVVGLVTGLITLGCAAELIVHRYRQGPR